MARFNNKIIMEILVACPSIHSQYTLAMQLSLKQKAEKILSYHLFFLNNPSLKKKKV